MKSRKARKQRLKIDEGCPFRVSVPFSFANRPCGKRGKLYAKGRRWCLEHAEVKLEELFRFQDRFRSLVRECR